MHSLGGVVGDRLRGQAELEPDRRVLSFGGGWTSMGELDDRSERLARGLFAFGVGKGDRVATILPNRLEAAEITFACSKIGAIVVPLNVYLKGEFLRYQLVDSAPSVVIVDMAGLRALDPLRGSLAGVKGFVCVDGPVPGSAGVHYPDLLTAGRPIPRTGLSAAETMAIFYTSGTTGSPKGCLVSHGYALNTAAAYHEFGHTRDADVVLTAWPLFHAAAFGTLMAATMAGSSAVSFEPAFSASTFLDRAREIDATVMRGVGAMAMAMLGTAPSELDRSHRIERAFIFPLSPRMQVTFEDRFGMAVLSEAWGQTECNPATWARYEDERRRDTNGRPLPWIEVAVVDSDDEAVPVGEVGEIVLRGKRPNSLFSGYWRNAAASVEAFRNLWHHTGDYGFLDEAGHVTYVDRKKDALRRRGENVSSLELEAAITTHPMVAQAAVHAIPSELTEDDIKACVVLVEGGSVSPEELFGFFRDTLPYYAVPRYVEILDALPANAMGRVLKYQLRERGNGPGTWDFDALGLTVDRAARR